MHDKVNGHNILSGSTPKSVTFPAEPRLRYSVLTVNALAPDRQVTISAAVAALCPDVALGAPRRRRLGLLHSRTLLLGHVARDRRPVGRVRRVHATLAVSFRRCPLPDTRSRLTGVVRQVKSIFFNS